MVLYSAASWKHPFGLVKLIEWASKYGYHGLGIRGMSFDTPISPTPRDIWAFGYDMIGPKFLSQKAKRDLCESVQSHGLYISEITAYTPLAIAPESNRKKSVEIFHQYIDLAAELGAKRIEPVPAANTSMSGLTKNQGLKLLTKSLQSIVPHAKDVGLPILIEANEGSLIHTAEACLDIVNELDSDLFEIVYDAINLYFEKQDVFESLRHLGNRIAVVHSKNARRSKPDREKTFNIKGYGYKWAPISEGDLNWKEIFVELKKVGFDGDVMYEYANPFKGMKRGFWADIPDPEVWVEENAKFMKEIMYA
jgi:sugar phosphate isomerase/epimerase